jgi:hypothetical protein
MTSVTLSQHGVQCIHGGTRRQSRNNLEIDANPFRETKAIVSFGSWRDGDDWVNATTPVAIVRDDCFARVDAYEPHAVNRLQSIQVQFC